MIQGSTTWLSVLLILAPAIIVGVTSVLSSRYGAKSVVDAAEKQVNATLEATDKNNQASLERVRHERIVEKQQEIAGELYGQFRDLVEQISDEINSVHYPSQDSRRPQSFASENKYGEVRAYFARHSLWLDSNSYELYDNALSQMLGLIGMLNMALYDPGVQEDSRKEILHDTKERYWSEEFKELDASLRNGLKASVGLTEEVTNAEDDAVEQRDS